MNTRTKFFHLLGCEMEFATELLLISYLTVVKTDWPHTAVKNATVRWNPTAFLSTVFQNQYNRIVEN